MTNILLKISTFFFFCFTSVEASDSIYTVRDNQIFLQNEENVLETRQKARNLAFRNAFFLLAKKILEPSELRKLDDIDEIKYSDLIKDFKIVEEKITDINYSANISVNFNSFAILSFFEDYNIESKVVVSEEYLLFPLFKKFNTFYLWENDNDWYDFLVNEYDELGLLKLYFPEKNHINKLKISAEQILDEEVGNVQKFLNFYNKKKAIIVFLKEDYNLDLNKLNSIVSAKLFANNKFTDIKLFESGTYEESSQLSNAKLISKITMNELEIWWKNQIDLVNSKSEGEYLFLLKLDNSDLKKNIDIEKKINQLLGRKGFYLYEFDTQKIIYKIETKYSIEQLNLALEPDNLKLIKSNQDEDYYLLQSY